MRRSKVFGSLRRALISALFGVGVTGCGFLRRADTPIDRSQDPRIQQEVAARLAGEPSLGAQSIRVAVDGGIVILHGSVQGIGAWQCAVTTSGLVRGVRSVVDYLVIDRGPRDVSCIAPRAESAPIAGGP